MVPTKAIHATQQATQLFSELQHKAEQLRHEMITQELLVDNDFAEDREELNALQETQEERTGKNREKVVEENAEPVFSDKLKDRLRKQQYRIIGSHSAVKTCGWTKSSLTGKGGCYKQKFYGIQSHQCVQMTTYLTCANFCTFCWRDMTAKAHNEFKGTPDDPKMILDNAVEGQKKLLIGYKGHQHIDKQKYEESQFPKHFAISLTGEPILYPRLQEMITYAHSKDSTTFVVCSGQFPEQMDAITPTQLYLSLDAPTKNLFIKIDKSINKDSWERLLGSLDALKRARERCRTVVRITCVKEQNMVDPQEYAKLIERANPMFLEVKGYMFVGSSRQRLSLKNSPFHEDVKAFAEEIARYCDYKVIDESACSRVVLMMKEDVAERFLER